MKMKKRSKSNVNFYQINMVKKNSQRLKDSSKQIFPFDIEKKSVSKKNFQKEISHFIKSYPNNLSHDKIFLKLLSKKTKKINPEKTIKTMKTIKDKNIIVSKSILSRVIESISK